MIYDNYLELDQENIVPFIDFTGDTESSYRVVYPLKNYARCYLNMWIQNEKEGYFLYFAIVRKEEIGISFEIGPAEPFIKVLLMEKFGRATKKSFYSANMKASCFAKDMVEVLLSNLEVDWKHIHRIRHFMSAKPFGGWQDAFCERKSYYYNEQKI